MCVSTAYDYQLNFKYGTLINMRKFVRMNRGKKSLLHTVYISRQRWRMSSQGFENAKMRWHDYKNTIHVRLQKGHHTLKHKNANINTNTIINRPPSWAHVTDEELAQGGEASFYSFKYGTMLTLNVINKNFGKALLKSRLYLEEVSQR